MRSGAGGGDLMGITALVMAGGKGTRMKLPVEKPLISVCGRPSIEYVLAALKTAKKIDRIFVATTDFTPKTTALMKEIMTEDDELITVYFGKDVSQEDAQVLTKEISEQYDECDVEMHRGGQPLYYYLVSVE